MRAFRPNYVLMLGPGRAIGSGVHEGDVVISERIQGFGYAEPLHDLHARRDWDFGTDPAIAAIARVVDVDDAHSAGTDGKHSVHVGVVAAVA